ncbi:MAG TPA: FecR domain-containing protein, partial [Polyangiales bacterium]
MSRSLTELVVDTASTELPSASRERAIGRAFERAAEPRLPPRSVWRARSLGLAVAAVAALALLIQLSMRTPAAPVAWLEQDGTYTFAHAQVTLLDRGRARFDAHEVTLELARGAVEVDVDPGPRRPFAVRTQYFRVEVLGTQFHVDRDSVAVTRGHVRVVALQGGRLLADLRAGQRYDRTTITTAPSPAPRV